MAIDEITNNFTQLGLSDLASKQEVEFIRRIKPKVSGSPTNQFSLPEEVNAQCLSVSKKTDHCFLSFNRSLYIASPTTIIDELHKNPFFEPSLLQSFPDGNTCVVGFTNASAKFEIDVETKNIVRGFNTQHNPFAIPSAMTAGDHTLFCGHENGLLTLHDRKIQQPIFSLPSPESTRVSVNKRLRMTTELSFPELHIRNPLQETVEPSSEEKKVFVERRQRHITTLSLSNDENRLAAAFSNGKVMFWDIRRGFDKALFSRKITRDQPIKAIAWDPEKSNRFFVGTKETPSRLIMYDVGGSSPKSLRQSFAENPIENICFVNSFAAITPVTRGPAPLWHIGRETTSQQALMGERGRTLLSSHFLSKSSTVVALTRNEENKHSIASWNISEKKATEHQTKQGAGKGTKLKKRITRL